MINSVCWQAFDYSLSSLVPTSTPREPKVATRYGSATFDCKQGSYRFAAQAARRQRYCRVGDFGAEVAGLSET